MSDFDSGREIFEVGSGFGGGRNDEDDDEDDDNAEREGGPHGRDEKEKKNRRRLRNGYGKDFTKAKEVVLHPFTKAKKRLIRLSETLSSSSSSANTSGCFSGKKAIDGCLCFKQPSTLESSAESRTSDPNDPDFTSAMLKTLVEKNDFYCKECNTHIV